VAVILASASPRRRDLMARIAFPYRVLPAEIDEMRRPGEDAVTYVRRVAVEKGRRVSLEQRGDAVLAADTIVVLDGDVLGKPEDDADARRMLARLSAREHLVLTAVVWARSGEIVAEDLVESRVLFRELGGGEIERYVATGEPADKAGAYAIQGGAARFVRRVTGSVTNVIGLPLEETLALARRIGAAQMVQPLPAEAVALRLRGVSGEVAARAVASGRDPATVRLVAVTKGHPAELAAAAIDAGAADLGENYVQAAAGKREAIGARGGVRWHLIGPLQRNKAGLAARTFELVHTIDRGDVAAALAQRAEKPICALVQVNIARDPAKSGVAPEGLSALARELRAVPRLEVRGLMTIGPMDAPEGDVRATFATLRELLPVLRAAGHESAAELSMGMSDDYHLAIAEGATLVRLGTAIFGPRPRPAGHAG
jgi:MAF protein